MDTGKSCDGGSSKGVVKVEASDVTDKKLMPPPEPRASSSMMFAGPSKSLLLPGSIDEDKDKDTLNGEVDSEDEDETSASDLAKFFCKMIKESGKEELTSEEIEKIVSKHEVMEVAPGLNLHIPREQILEGLVDPLDEDKDGSKFKLQWGNASDDEACAMEQLFYKTMKESDEEKDAEYTRKMEKLVSDHQKDLRELGILVSEEEVRADLLNDDLFPLPPWDNFKRLLTSYLHEGGEEEEEGEEEVEGEEVEGVPQIDESCSEQPAAKMLKGLGKSVASTTSYAGTVCATVVKEEVKSSPEEKTETAGVWTSCENLAEPKSEAQSKNGTTLNGMPEEKEKDVGKHRETEGRIEPMETEISDLRAIVPEVLVKLENPLPGTSAVSTEMKPNVKVTKSMPQEENVPKAVPLVVQTGKKKAFSVVKLNIPRVPLVPSKPSVTPTSALDTLEAAKRLGETIRKAHGATPKPSAESVSKGDMK